MKDQISIKRIEQLHPKVRKTFSDFISECEYTLNITLRIMEPVFRSIEEQNELYEKGRSTPGKIVTNAKGGTSYHNYGLAIDLVRLDDSLNPDWEYDNSLLNPIAEKYELEWGGKWTHKDKPHFEKRFGFNENCSDLILLDRDDKGYPIF